MINILKRFAGLLDIRQQKPVFIGDLILYDIVRFHENTKWILPTVILKPEKLITGVSVGLFETPDLFLSFISIISLTRQGALKAARSREQGRSDKVANIQSLGYTLGGPHGITNEEARRKIERAVLRIKEPVR